MERKHSIFRNIVDFYKTAPFGETIIIANISLGIYAHTWESMAFGSALALSGLPATLIQFGLRRRLEGSIKKYGYSDDAFQTTLKEWCDRQTAQVVVDRYGYSDEYSQLRKNYTGQIKYFCIPNF